MTTHFRDRCLAWLLVAVATALVVARLWLLQGVTTRVEIDGGSMAEALPGEHVEFTCSKCTRAWRVDAAQVDGAYLACPECGQVVDEQTARVERAATRVMIDRAAYLLERPQRFDIVAFHASDSDELAVKRLVALPGEAWRIDQGEIFIGDEMVRKSYPQFQELASVVAATPRRWRGGEQTRWQQADSHWTCRTSGDTIDWLTYHHAAAHPAANGQSSPVQDLDTYNPALPRELNVVYDLVAQCRVTASGGVLRFRVHDLLLDWDLAAGSIVARRREERLASVSTARGDRNDAAIAWGICDGRLWLVLNDQVVLQHTLTQSRTPATSSAPLAIAASGATGCRLDGLHVLRDIYYFDAQNRGGVRQPEPLGKNEFALLGDNPPLSIDSRHWESGVPRKSILGKVWPLPK